MVWHLLLCDDELGQRVGEGLGITADDVRGLKPLPTQGWGEAEQQRLDNLGNNGPRDVEGLDDDALRAQRARRADRGEPIYEGAAGPRAVGEDGGGHAGHACSGSPR